MKSLVDAKAFSAALSKVSHGLEKSALPILEEVRVVFRGDRCALIATNLDQWVAAELPAAGDSFSFVLHRTKSAAKTCAYFDGALSLELTGTKDALRLSMTCGRRAVQLDVMDSEDYPKMPDFTAEESDTVDAAHLLARVNRVKYAADKGTRRPEFGGIRFQDSRIACVDGYRLTVDRDEALTVRTPFVVPKKAMEQLKLFGAEQITLSRNKRYLLFSGDGLIVLSVLLPDSGFQLDGCIPQTFREEFSMLPKDFLRELEFLNQGVPPTCKKDVRFDRGDLCLHTAGTKHSAHIEFDGKSTIAFAFDLPYMVDAMKQFSTARWVTLHISGAYSPIVITAEGRSDMALILPIRLREAVAA